MAAIGTKKVEAAVSVMVAEASNLALLEGGGQAEELLHKDVPVVVVGSGGKGGEAVQAEEAAREESRGRFSRRESKSTAMLKLSRRPSCSGEGKASLSRTLISRGWVRGAEEDIAMEPTPLLLAAVAAAAEPSTEEAHEDCGWW